MKSKISSKVNISFAAKLLLAAVSVSLSCCGGSKFVPDASGTFEATEIIVSAEIVGKVMALNISQGSDVVAGAELGFIDTTLLHLQKLQLMSSTKAVDSRRQDVSKQVAVIEEQIATQKRERTRMESLVAANAANTKAVDDIVSAIAVLEKQLAAQRSLLQSGNRSLSEEGSAVELQIAQIEEQLRKCRIFSPIDGTVLAKYVEAGEVATAGRSLFKVARLDSLTLRAYITSGQLSMLKLGQRVAVFSDYGDKDTRRYEGAVTWISDKSEFTPKTIQTRDQRANLVYPVKIVVKNDGLLKIGMYGDVKFELE